MWQIGDEIARDQDPDRVSWRRCCLVEWSRPRLNETSREGADRRELLKGDVSRGKIKRDLNTWQPSGSQYIRTRNGCKSGKSVSNKSAIQLHHKIWNYILLFKLCGISLSWLPGKMCQSRLYLLISHWFHEKIWMFTFRWLAQKKLCG